MRDALGGLVNIVIIVVFLVLVSGYLAFNVNYTKAFRVKNKIITNLEQYEGSCSQTSKCGEDITEYMRSVGYNVSSSNLVNKDDWDVCPNGYCIRQVKVETQCSGDKCKDSSKKVYYEVGTFITIDIPIIKNIMPNIKLFQVNGATKTFEKIN